VASDKARTWRWVSFATALTWAVWQRNPGQL
jgi:tryptophan-rich sensory protein